MAKRHVPDPACSPKPLTLDDLRSLQNYIDNTFADARTTKTAFHPTRKLTNISTFDGARSEGDVVRLSPYLTIARDEGSTSPLLKENARRLASGCRRDEEHARATWSHVLMLADVVGPVGARKP